VALHAEGEGLDAEEDEKGVEGAEGGPEIPEKLEARLGDVGGAAEGCGELQAVVAGVGLGELGEGAVGPVEAPGVDDDAADGGAVAAEVFGEGMDDDVGAPVEGPAEVGGGDGVVDDEGKAGEVGEDGDGLEVEGDVHRFTEGFG